jgi:hypothetical protein
MVEKHLVTGRSSWRLMAALGVLILTGAACRGNNDSVASASSGSPSATFAKPPQVTGTTVTIGLASSGIDIRPANGDGSGHTGHFVVFVDQDPPAPGTAIPTNLSTEGVIHSADPSVTLRGEDPGSHRLVVTLADGNNARLGDGTDTATAVVKGSGLGMSVDQSTPTCQGAQVTVVSIGFSLPVVAGPATLSAKGDVTVPSTTTTTTLPSVTDLISPAVTTTTTAAPAAAGSPSTTAGPTTTAPPPPPAQISYFLDRPPTSAAATPTDFGSLTSASLAVCVTGLTSGRHTVWAVTVDSSGAPLTTPIESKFSFTVS